MFSITHLVLHGQKYDKMLIYHKQYQTTINTKTMLAHNVIIKN